MNKCSPVEMKKNLMLVEEYKKAGIDFVPVPVLDEENKKIIAGLVLRQLDEIIKNGG